MRFGGLISAQGVRAIALGACLAACAWAAQAADLAPADGDLDGAGLDSLDPWSLVPLSGARLSGQARLDARQEIKLSTQPGGYFSANFSSYGPGDFGAGALRLDSSAGLDQPRATYRYTWLSMRDLDLKVGLTSNLSTLSTSLHSNLSPSLRFGSLPQMHLSGVGRLNSNWQVTLDADGLWTARGRSLDVDLHIDYSLSRSMQVFGGYRISDYSGDAEDFYGTANFNTANVGLRYRF